MTPEEKQLVTGLFDRLKQADSQGKDPEADALISQAVAAQPASPYLLVQTLLVQEHALANAQTRIAALEKQIQQAPAATPRSGGFLGGLLGSGVPAQPPAAPPQAYQAPQPAYQQPGYQQPGYAPPPSYAPTTSMAPSSGSGFLGSAVRTAAGVAGGALLFEGISSLLSHNAGPFSGGLGGGGLLGGGGMFGGGQSAPTEVINNYYEAPSAPPSGGYDQDSSGGGSDQSYDPPPDPGYAPDGGDPGTSGQDDDSTQV